MSSNPSGAHAVDRLFPVLTVVTLLGPAVLGGLISWSWWGAFTAFFWAGLVRVALLHHVTWSVNSLCHMIGDRPFAAPPGTATTHAVSRGTRPAHSRRARDTARGSRVRRTR